MQKNRILSLWGAALLLASLVSCSTARQITILRDLEYYTPYPAKPVPDLTIQPGDVLSVSVFSENPLLAAPFNGTLSTSGTPTGAKAEVTYAVDSLGRINYPVLGGLKVEGFTTRQIEDEIASRIKALGYIKDPVVNVELSNFTITILGAGNSVMTVKGPSMDLLKVVAQAGGIGRNIKMDDVMVIRTENGRRMAYRVNLYSKDIFDSPVFYMRQNDIVYFKPQGWSLRNEATVIMSMVHMGMTLGNIITNYLLWSSK